MRRWRSGTSGLMAVVSPRSTPLPRHYAKFLVFQWRAGIKEKLDGMICDALVEVKAILEAEDLLIKDAA
ncbi:hypothetical protein D3C78_1683290 [compost metagenome]